MELSKELEQQIDSKVPFEEKEKIYTQIMTEEGWRKWRLERIKKASGIEVEDVEINGEIYRVAKENKK